VTKPKPPLGAPRSDASVSSAATGRRGTNCQGPSRLNPRLLRTMRLGLLLLLVAAWTLGGAASASYPGTNGKIGFVRFDDGFDIYSVNPNGSDLDRLTGARSDYEPTWSPDGSMVAFDRIVSGRYQVFTMDADGSNRSQITSGEADNLWSTWYRMDSRSPSPATAIKTATMRSIR